MDYGLGPLRDEYLVSGGLIGTVSSKEKAQVCVLTLYCLPDEDTARKQPSTSQEGSSFLTPDLTLLLELQPSVL